MDSPQTFKDNLKFGKTAESKIARFFLDKNYGVLPIYEKEILEGKGPTVFFQDKEIIGTDMLIFKGDKIYWIEAKHKTAFSWHRITSRWVTGIDIHHYENYIEIMKRTEWPVWLIFYHEGGQSKDSPEKSPEGLFGNELYFLIKNENHRSNNWGKHGMVYWSIDKLKLIKEKL